MPFQWKMFFGHPYFVPGEVVSRVRCRHGDAHLSGARNHGHAQGLQRIVWDGTRSVGVRPAERACVSVLEWAAQPAEGIVLGRKWSMGVREANREGTILLA